MCQAPAAQDGGARAPTSAEIELGVLLASMLPFVGKSPIGGAGAGAAGGGAGAAGERTESKSFAGAPGSP